MTSSVQNRPSQYKREFARVVEKTLGHTAKSTPSRAATAVLALLYDTWQTAVQTSFGLTKGLHGSEIARRIGQGQANTTNLTLPRLYQMGLIGFSVQPNPRGGGRPLHVWSLTEKGLDIGLLAYVENRAASPQFAKRSSSVPRV